MDDGFDGKALRIARLVLDPPMTLDELARRAQVDPSAVSRFETGLRVPTPRTLKKTQAVIREAHARQQSGQ
jgi:transcriptional regulator with XRE-family HTH domain